MKRWITLFIVVFLYLSPVEAQGPIIVTVAGGGPNNMPAVDANVMTPLSVAVDAFGNLFVTAGSNQVFRVNPTGVITVVAGIGTAGGFSGDGELATVASLAEPRGVAVDVAGDLYIADSLNNRIRRVNAVSGIISTVAGNGFFDFQGDGGPAIFASLRSPHGVAIDEFGNLFIADSANHRVRRVDSATGIITTVAGNGLGGFGGDGGQATSASLHFPIKIAVDGSGNLFIADMFNDRVRRVDAGTGIITTVAGNGLGGFGDDGVPATSTNVWRPSGVELDSVGNLFITDRGSHRVRRVDASTGIITTIAGNGVADYSGDGDPATSASINNPNGIALDHTNNLFISDSLNNRVRQVDGTTGVITTKAGNGTSVFSGDMGPADLASLSAVHGVAVNQIGDLFLADFGNNRIRRVDADSGIITTVAGNGLFAFGGDGGPAISASLRNPQGVTIDEIGNLFIADTSNHRVRRVDAVTGIITTVAGTGIAGFSGDGVLAVSSRLWNPRGVAIDQIGNLFIGDFGNNRVRRVDADTGIITTVAGNGIFGSGPDGAQATSISLRSPSGVVLDDTGNLFFSERGNARVRRVDAVTGIITTVATVFTPNGVALDEASNLYIAEENNHRIRRVDAATGIISTVAGTGAPGFSGDGGLASNALLRLPTGVAIDSAGNLYIGDTQNRRIRKVDVSTPPDSDGDGVPDHLDPCPLVPTEPTLVSYAGQLLVATGADKLATVLFEAGLFLTADGAPVMDEEIVFTPMNSEGVLLPDCTGITDGQGIAACQLAGVPPDVYAVLAQYQGVEGCFEASHEQVLLVVYDPEVPRATGGGFFYPDAESTLPAASPQDKAHFGFMVRIDKNQAAAGNLEFQYQAAGINLKSQGMEWYTVSNNKAMFQGTATINGAGLYTFRVAATDGDLMGGQPDSFDIRIWAGTDTESDPVHKAKNDLAGGNIVVHKK